MLGKLAWRNIWRNKRRTFITVSSIAFAVFFAVTMRSMQIGVYDLMIENVVGVYSGYLQIHADGYWEDQNLNNSLENDREMMQAMHQHEVVNIVAPRLEGFALAASQEKTKGVMLVGVDPKAETNFMKLDANLQAGSLFHAQESAIVLGEGIAEYFKVDVGDTLVFLGQGYHGANAAGKYFVKGITRFKSPNLNENLVLMPLQTSQEFYGAPGRLTALALKIDKPGQLEQAKAHIGQFTNDKALEVMDWKEMMPELVQAIQADSSGGIIMLMILYMVIFFGMFGTILMMTTERQYEFGVLVAVGMRKWKISWMLFQEMVMMSVIGLFVGGLLSFPLVWYFNSNPIALTGNAAESMKEYGFEALIQTSTDPSIFWVQASVILVLAAVICLYPVFVISKLKPVEAMRH